MEYFVVMQNISKGNQNDLEYMMISLTNSVVLAHLWYLEQWP